MIVLCINCLLKHKFIEKKWDNLPAFLFFTTYKNVYVNGKPLKWYTFFRNGDIVEVVERPVGIGLAIAGYISSISAGLATIVTVGGVGLGFTYGTLLGTVAVVGLAVFSAKLGKGLGEIGVNNSNTDAPETKAEIKGSSNSVSTSIIPVVYGKTRQTPFYGQLPYRLVQDGGSTNIYRQYFISNYSNILISDEKFLETPISDYSAEYIDSTISHGGSTFIGFPNVKAITRDEHLSADTDVDVNQSSIVNYNEDIESNSLTYQFSLRFENVVITSWSDKTFKVELDIVSNGVVHTLVENFTIQQSDLVLESGEIYTYDFEGQEIFHSNIEFLVKTTFSPVTNTRNTTEEILSELDCFYVFENITAGDFSSELILNKSVNKYTGEVTEIIETSPKNTTEIDVVISFPQGLYTNEENGERSSRSSKIDIKFKPKGGSFEHLNTATLKIRDLNGELQDLSTSSTTVVDSVMTVYSPDILARADELFFRGITLIVPADTYSIKVKSADLSEKTTADIGTPVCSEFNFYVDNDPIDKSFLPKVTQISIETTAYKGLSGTLKKYNYTVEVKIPVWDGQNWDTISTTSNPASIIRDILTNKEVNPRAESVDLLDNDSLVELFNWCESETYKAYTMITNQSKILDIIAQILVNCQSSFTRRNGKYVFVIDREGKVAKGLFGLHNSYNFKWTPTTGRITEAIRASFINSETDTQDEFTAYWYDDQINFVPENGKDDSDYLIIKNDYNYVNDIDVVKKIVEYELSTTQTKRNKFEFSVNLEALTLDLFDRVFVTNTCEMQEQSTGRIKEVIVDGEFITGFKLYSHIEIAKDSSITIRSLDYSSELTAINIYAVTNDGETDTINIDPIIHNGVIRGKGEIQGNHSNWDYDGDLFSIGVATPYDCVVINIRYNEDLTATIVCREY